jgi:regulator of sigma E protease
MLLEKIIIFIIFLGPLVFFHELGHFLFARLFGVRVEVFSIGFGPKILKKKYGETEYAISIIPLGGYVKMFGDDPFNKDSIPEEERSKSFTHQGKWARFWIVMGGPLANFILAFVIFFSLLMMGERIPEIKIGSVSKESVLYQSGLRAGDVIVKLNESDVYNPSDLMVEGNKSVTSLGIKRNDQVLNLKLDIAGDKFFDEVMKAPPLLKKPFLIDNNGQLFALSLDSSKVNFNISIEEISNLTGISKVYLFPIVKDEDLSKDEVKYSTADVKEFSVNFTDTETLLKNFEAQNLRTIDLMVRSVNMGSPADKAGIKANDVFISLEGEKVFSFEELRSKLQNISKSAVDVEVYSAGVLKKFSITPDVTTQEGKTIKLLGVYSNLEVLKTNFVLTKSKGFLNSVSVAVSRTWDSMKKTVDGFVKLLTNQVSLKSIGGPLAIGKVAHDSFNTSLSYFFQLMALISVNLGVINLFPIPVLDGGHIMFIALEVLNGGPLSRRKMEIAQQVGLSVLLMLMVGAIFNDVVRFF